MRRAFSFAKTGPSTAFWPRANFQSSMTFVAGMVMRTTSTWPWKCARTDVAPGRTAFTRPSGVTVTVVSSFEKNCASQVTSRIRPSGQCARASSCCASPGRNVLDEDIAPSPGAVTPLRISNREASASWSAGKGPGARAAIQAASVRWWREPSAKRTLPSCATSPSGFVSSSDSSGAAGLIRRAAMSSVSQPKSSSGA